MFGIDEVRLRDHQLGQYHINTSLGGTEIHQYLQNLSIQYKQYRIQKL